MALKTIVSKDDLVSSLGLDLFENLIQKTPEIIRNIIQKLLADPDITLRNDRRKELGLLVKQ